MIKFMFKKVLSTKNDEDAAGVLDVDMEISGRAWRNILYSNIFIEVYSLLYSVQTKIF